MDVLMPQLGETVAEGTVSAWHKQVGDPVEADEVLLDVETDKTSMEIPSPGAGKLQKILVEVGQTVDVGTVLAVIETAQGAGAASAEPAASEAPSDASPGSPGGDATIRQPALETAPAESAGGSAGSAPAAGTAAAAAVATETRPAQRDAGRRLSPAVRRLVAEHSLDVSALNGTGRDGRLTRRDVLRHIAQGGAERGPGAAPQAHAVRSETRASYTVTPRPQPSPAASPAAGGDGGADVQPFNRIRRLTAEHMVRSKTTSPHVLQAVEVDFSRVDRLRSQAREGWRSTHGYSLTYLPFIAAAVCTALREFPQVNSSVENDGLVLHPGVHLAIAVDLGPEGLVAPVIRGADRLGVPELAEAIRDVSARARNGRLGPDDLSGGTYTLSNSGTFGTLITAPIINQPQVAILSIDGVRKRPVVIELDEGDAIAIRPVGILAQSFDHRAFDGAYSAAFLDRVRTLLEQTDWKLDI